MERRILNSIDAPKTSQGSRVSEARRIASALGSSIVGEGGKKVPPRGGGGKAIGARRVRPSLYHAYFDADFFQRAQFIFSNIAVRNDLVNQGRSYNQAQTAPPKFAGVANHHHVPGNFNHHPIYFGLQQVRRG